MQWRVGESIKWVLRVLMWFCVLGRCGEGRGGGKGGGRDGVVSDWGWRHYLGCLRLRMCMVM